MADSVPPLNKYPKQLARRLSWIIALFSGLSCISCFNIWEYFIPLYQQGVPTITIYERYYSTLSPIIPLLIAILFLLIGILTDVLNRKKPIDPAKKYYLMAFLCMLYAAFTIVSNIDFVVR